jgi:hypothetical protein
MRSDWDELITILDKEDEERERKWEERRVPLCATDIELIESLGVQGCYRTISAPLVSE